jgi:hypothetical protein
MEWVYALHHMVDHAVVDLDGAQVIAHNIRSKEEATLMAAAPRMAEALRQIQANASGFKETQIYMDPSHRRLFGLIEERAQAALQEIDDD